MEGRKRQKLEDFLDRSEDDIGFKFVAALASPWLVSIITHDAVAEGRKHDDKLVMFGNGSIIECVKSDTSQYVATVITAATLFQRPPNVQPRDFRVDVHLWDGRVCRGQVLACDFHYNLAALSIESDSVLQTATLRHVDDSVSIRPADHPPSPLSETSLKLLPGTKISILRRSYGPFGTLEFNPGVFRETKFENGYDCNDLYWVADSQSLSTSGKPVINSSGELIGIAFHDCAFLPINIVSTWWNHFKTCGEYRRPWLGMEVANLHASRLEILEEFVMKFPDVSTGVVVTKVVEDSSAYCAGLRPKDVIVTCNGKSLGSKLEFFDMMWTIVEEPIELEVLRASNGEKFKLSVRVRETTQKQFYKWPSESVHRLNV